MPMEICTDCICKKSYGVMHCTQAQRTTVISATKYDGLSVSSVPTTASLTARAPRRGRGPRSFRVKRIPILKNAFKALNVVDHASIAGREEQAWEHTNYIYMREWCRQGGAPTRRP